MTGPDLRWRAEEACLNAWPARHGALLGGWILRLSGGRYRRPNSITPLDGRRCDPSEAIAAAQAIYRSHGQVPIFRIVSMAQEMDAELDLIGYPREGDSLTIAGELAMPGAEDERVQLRLDASPAWLRARHQIVGEKPVDAAIFDEMVRLIVLPKAFAAILVDGQIASVAYGVTQNRLLVIESVATHTNHRGSGLARRVLQSLFAWGRRSGADTACLQLIADNQAALRLYRGLGLKRELFRYHYRRCASND